MLNSINTTTKQIIAVFSALSAKTTLDALSSSTIVVGVFIGSAAWWLVLALCVARLQDKISDTTMLRINQTAGAALIGFGVWQLQNRLL
ncbi:LysE family transporter [Litoribacillus peritrichatus]|uniref:LysE family transporter n=1 Tax=Litoribacillus peritrichatus TaxID=718191 RepID=UPI0031DAC7FA